VRAWLADDGRRLRTARRSQNTRGNGRVAVGDGSLARRTGIYGMDALGRAMPTARERLETVDGAEEMLRERMSATDAWQGGTRGSHGNARRAVDGARDRVGEARNALGTARDAAPGRRHDDECLPETARGADMVLEPTGTRAGRPAAAPTGPAQERGTASRTLGVACSASSFRHRELFLARVHLDASRTREHARADARADSPRALPNVQRAHASAPGGTGRPSGAPPAPREPRVPKRAVLHVVRTSFTISGGLATRAGGPQKPQPRLT
jgi:hypothetical protein